MVGRQDAWRDLDNMFRRVEMDGERPVCPQVSQVSPGFDGNTIQS